MKLESEISSERSELFKFYRINADNTSKKHLVIFWILFVAFLIIIFVTSNFTPTAFIFKSNRTQVQQTSLSTCDNPSIFYSGDLTCKEFSTVHPKLGLLLRNIEQLNQLAQIQLLFMPKSNTYSTQYQLDLTIQVNTLQKYKKKISENYYAYAFKRGQIIDQKSVQFESDDYSIQSVTDQYGNKRDGFEIDIAYFRHFKAENYLILITFDSLTQTFLDQYDIVAKATLMNPDYSKFVIIVRLVFFGLMSFTFCYFLYRLKKQSKIFLCEQQKIVLILSISILFYNDPLFIVSVYKPSIAGVFFSTLFLVQFLVILIFSWIYLLEKIYYEKDQGIFVFTTSKKCLYTFGFAFIFGLLLAFDFKISYYAYSQDPVIIYDSHFKAIFIISAVVFALLFLLLSFLHFRICRIWSETIWRNKIYIAFSSFFVILLVIFGSLGWLSFYDESSQKFEILYSSLNLYIVYLQYMYSMQNEEEFGSHKIQDMEELKSSATITLNSSLNEGSVDVKFPNYGGNAQNQMSIEDIDS